MKKRFLLLLLAISLVLIPNVPAQAASPADPGFTPGALISDAAFADTATFGSAAGVQQFLQAQNSILARTDADFLAKLKEPTDAALKTQLQDVNPNLGRLRTAAELIYDASRSSGLNPQVIIVTLQKEQSLINKNFTVDSDLQRALDRALGYGCADSSPCQANFLSFYRQLFGTIDTDGDRWIGGPLSLFRSFSTTVNGVRVGKGPAVDANNNAYGPGPYVRTSKMGDTITLQNTLGGYEPVQEFQTVTLSNAATAALYRYTPHVFNGNYNFWRFYNAWFRYPNGTIIKLSGDSTMWYIENGYRKSLSPYVAAARNINTSNQIVVSQTELNSYVLGERLILPEGTLVKSEADGITYYIQNGQLHKITAFTAAQRKLDFSKTITVPVSEISTFPMGNTLFPLEGTLLRSSSNGGVYVMVAEQKRPLSFFVFTQRKYSFANVNVLSDAEVADIPLGSIMPPLDGTLVRAKGDMGVYYVENGLKRPVSYIVFVQRKFSFGSVAELSVDEMNNLSLGSALPMSDGTLVKSPTSLALYQLTGGQKVFITFGVYIQRQLNLQPVVTLPQDQIDALPKAEFTLSPKEGTLLRPSDSQLVYLVEGGILKPMTYEAFVARNFRFSSVVVWNPDEVALMQKGETLLQ